MENNSKILGNKGAITIIVLIAIVIVIGILIVSKKSFLPLPDEINQKQIERPVSAYLHTFPDGVDSLIIVIGPEREEGVALPLSATAYDISGSNWWQTTTWDGKKSPIYKKGQSAYRPIKRNRNINEATFWLRGEGECMVKINR